VNLLRYTLLVLVLFALFSSCRRDKFTDVDRVDLILSTDTVFFDTVFTTVGSITKRFKIINPYKDNALIESIYVANPSADFRINVNGIKGDKVDDVEVLGNDSIYVFVEVTVSPGSVNEPFVKEDQIIIETRNNIEEVQLVAWGQDAYFFRNALIFDPNAASLAFPNDKPLVFYGFSFIGHPTNPDSSIEAIFQENSQIHFHANSGLYVGPNSSLKMLGLPDNEIIVQGDRLEPAYEEIAGQWERIWLSATSKENVIEHTIIKNGNIGIQVDSVGNSTAPTLSLKNVFIRNMSGAGLLAQGSSVYAENSIFSNCGRFVVALAFGGDYQFLHCTMANYWNQSSRTDPVLLLNNYFETENGNVARPLTQAYFGNCIIHGANDEEIELDSVNTESFLYTFDHCILKTERNLKGSNIINILKNPANLIVDGFNQNPFFVDYSNHDLRLLQQSVAIDLGSESIGSQVPEDFFGTMRTPNPDVGAIEFTP